MRILWTVNTMPPEFSKELGMRSTHAISWIDAMSKRIKLVQDVQLAIVASGGRQSGSVLCRNIDGITYYVLPTDWNKKDYWAEIISEFQPDVIHAYGTEGRHNLSLIENYGKKIPIIISLQGIVSGYLRYYYAGMSQGDILKSMTIGDLLLKRTIWSGRSGFKKQIPIERRMIQGVSYVEGRSTWDRVFSRSINKEVVYYECPRMIRAPFFDHQWNYDQCEPQTILVHQGNYPIKGLHMMLDALALIKEEYPRVKMYIAGNIRFQPKTLKQRLLFSGYTKHLRKKIHTLGLENNIECTGYLNADEMAAKLASVNVCVIPSAIENAPNSLAEAMIVGTPCVASYAGGSAEMLNQGECGMLYRYEEPEMLAECIRNYFGNEVIAQEKSENAQKVARTRHHPVQLVERLMGIYTDVVNDFHRQ